MSIKPLCEGDLIRAKTIYESSFPIEERRDWHKVVADNLPNLMGIYADGSFVGLITLWPFDAFLYVEHLAIDESMRGKEIGSVALRELIENTEVPIVLEIEPPTLSHQAEKRLRFYERLGFVPIDKSYIQPPYSPELPSLNLWLMSTSSAVNAKTIAKEIHAEVYGMD